MPAVLPDAPGSARVSPISTSSPLTQLISEEGRAIGGDPEESAARLPLSLAQIIEQPG